MINIDVFVFTKYHSNGPSSRYRYYNYVDCFKSNSINLNIKPFFSKIYLTNNNFIFKVVLTLYSYISRFFILIKLIIFPKKYQLVIIEYELFPFISSIFEKLLKSGKVPFIVDYDDAIFHMYDQHNNSVIRFLFKNKIANVMKYSNAIIVGNNYLKNYAQKYNSNILQLPTVVLLNKYKEAMSSFKNNSKNASFTIGWIGSRSTSVYLLDILPVIEKFVSSYNAKCNFIGFDETIINKDMQTKCNISIIPWSEETEIQEILKFDVGIMPLKNDAWSKGKCGFKLIQYMSCKKPVIASPVGININIVDEKENGFLADNNKEWYSSLEQLYNDNALQKKMGNNSWQKILLDYNHKLNCKKYIYLINQIVDQY